MVLKKGGKNMGKFEILQTKTGVKFNLKASNGEVIVSSQVYKAEKYCRKGIASVMANAPKAAIEDQTVEGYEVVKHPKFELYKDKAGEFRFRLKATNGQIIATGEVTRLWLAARMALNPLERMLLMQKLSLLNPRNNP